MNFVGILVLLLWHAVAANKWKDSNGGNIAIPWIGLGTAGLGGDTYNAVRKSLELGIRLIDTAQAQEWYQESEVGRALVDSELAEDVYVVTKVHPRSYEENKMRNMVRRSAMSLRINRPIDAILLHAPFCWRGHCSAEEEKVSWAVGWQNLCMLKREGLITSVGVSNFHLDQILSIDDDAKDLEIIQNWMDPFHQDREVRRYCREHGIAYMAYSSFGTQWEWKLGRNPVFSSQKLMDIAQRHETSIAQVVLSWLIQEGVVAIPRSSSHRHLEDNFAILQRGEGGDDSVTLFLDSSDMEVIRGLDGTLGRLWDDEL